MTRYMSCAETAKLVRAALKAAFPAVKFSVRSDSYSMGASIRVRWTDGPTESRVREITTQFEGADFDSMQDMKISRPDSIVNGERVSFGADYIFTTRDVSESHRVNVSTLVARYFGIELPLRGREDFVILGNYTFAQHVRMCLADRTHLRLDAVTSATA